MGLQTLYPYDDLPRPLDPPPLSAAGEVGPEAFERLETVPSWMLTPLEQAVSRNGGRYSVHGETFALRHSGERLWHRGSHDRPH